MSGPYTSEAERRADEIFAMAQHERILWLLDRLWNRYPGWSLSGLLFAAGFPASDDYIEERLRGELAK